MTSGSLLRLNPRVEAETEAESIKKKKNYILAAHAIHKKNVEEATRDNNTYQRRLLTFLQNYQTFVMGRDSENYWFTNYPPIQEANSAAGSNPFPTKKPKNQIDEDGFTTVQRVKTPKKPLTKPCTGINIVDGSKCIQKPLRSELPGTEGLCAEHQYIGTILKGFGRSNKEVKEGTTPYFHKKFVELIEEIKIPKKSVNIVKYCALKYVMLIFRYMFLWILGVPYKVGNGQMILHLYTKLNDVEGHHGTCDCLSFEDCLKMFRKFPEFDDLQQVVQNYRSNAPTRPTLGSSTGRGGNRRGSQSSPRRGRNANQRFSGSNATQSGASKSKRK